MPHRGKDFARQSREVAECRLVGQRGPVTVIRNTLLAVAAAFAWAATGQAAVWVSPSGDDRNAGTEEKPVQSLDKARDLVRALNRSMTDDITVFLSGIYQRQWPGLPSLGRPTRERTGIRSSTWRRPERTRS